MATELRETTASSASTGTPAFSVFVAGLGSPLSMPRASAATFTPCTRVSPHGASAFAVPSVQASAFTSRSLGLHTNDLPVARPQNTRIRRSLNKPTTPRAAASAQSVDPPRDSAPGGTASGSADKVLNRRIRRSAQPSVAESLRLSRDELAFESKQRAAAAAAAAAAATDAVPYDSYDSAASAVVDTEASPYTSPLTTGSSADAKTFVVNEAESREMQAAWERKGYANALSRTFEIWAFFFKCVTGESRIRKIKDPTELALARRKQAKLIKSGLLSLGPTFIKLGQLMSTRVDIVPKEYIEEFSVLQDRVPGFSGARAIEVIEAEFGRPIQDIYDDFEETPIAAASLGQVHRATLNGQRVAVKIQRAGLKELFDVDLKNLKLLAVFLDKIDPKNDGANRNWVSIYEESAKLLYEEIDYTTEARNADRFRENFKDTPWIKVPDVYWGYSSSRVLTMEYVPGIKINDFDAIERAGIDRKLLARRSAESYLTQLLRHGYFHTDPHCGNISCDAVEGGRLIVYDYGMMSSFPQNIKEGLVDVIFGIYEGSATDICDAMVRMEVLAPGADRITVEKVGRYFLDLFRTNLENENRSKSKEEKRAEMTKRLDSIGEDLLAVSEDECFNFPPVFTFVFRSFTTLEGIGKGLDPNYDLTLIAGPYLKELIDVRDGSVVASAVKTFRRKVGWRNEDISALVTQPRKTAYIEDTLRRMESGDLKLRVRVLESERSFKRMSLMQENMALALAAATFSNMACVLMSRAERFAVQAKIAWLIACVFAVRLIVGLLKARALERKQQKYIRGGM